MYFTKAGVTKVLHMPKDGRYDLPSFGYFLNWSMAQVASAQLYWVIYSP
jgi:hypothetical protein